MNGKKLPEKKKKGREGERARFQLMSSSCVTSLSFSVFFLSLRVSRFNKASCRVWLSWEMQQSVAGAEAGSGLVVRRGCKLGGEHFRPFSPCNTPRSLERWQPAVRSLPYVFFPFTPSSTSFPSFFSRSVPPRLRPSPSPLPISTIPPSFLPFPTPLPVVVLSMLAAVES